MKPVILMSNGKYFNFLDPDAAEYDIEVIAQGLSNCCRFTGHCEFYSVAQHSVLVSGIVPEEFALEGLLHDAHEAFTHDVSTPLKSILPDYRALEHRIERSVLKRFELYTTLHLEVKAADLRLLATEKRDLMPFGDGSNWPMIKGVQPLLGTIRPWSPIVAKRRFLDRFNTCT